ncbi:MAG: hypothetical protein DI619_04370 [Francisella sp.]|nr:MAG: hypothetical protein DI619_04370 [Francisella sp.]
MMIKRLCIRLILSLFLIQYSVAKPLQIVASFSIIADWVKQIGGEQVKVTSLIPFGAMRKYPKKLIFLENSYPRSQLLSFKNGSIDPHTWQDIGLSNRAVASITKALCLYDRLHCSFYLYRYRQYANQLIEFARSSMKVFSQLPAHSLLVTTHDGFHYLANRYGLEYLSLEPKHHHADISAKAIVDAMNQIQVKKPRCIFSEVDSNIRLSRQIAKSAHTCVIAGLYSDSLSATSGDAADYLQFMRHNMRLLIHGLGAR